MAQRRVCASACTSRSFTLTFASRAEPVLLGQQPARVDLAREHELRDLLAVRHLACDRALRVAPSGSSALGRRVAVVRADLAAALSTSPRVIRPRGPVPVDARERRRRVARRRAGRRAPPAARPSRQARLRAAPRRRLLCLAASAAGARPAASSPRPPAARSVRAQRGRCRPPRPRSSGRSRRVARRPRSAPCRSPARREGRPPLTRRRPRRAPRRRCLPSPPDPSVACTQA